MSEGTPKEGEQGYAEEQPGPVTGGNGESDRRDASKGDGSGDKPETDSGDGKATGNPRSAG